MRNDLGRSRFTLSDRVRGKGTTMLPAHYRARAATIRRLAEDVEDLLERARFFDFAAEYEKLASYARAANVRRTRISSSKVNSAVTGAAAKRVGRQ